MSVLSDIAHVGGDIASPVANGIGAVTGVNSLTTLGHNIGSPTATLSNPGGLIAGNDPAFTGSGAYASGSPATTSAATSNPVQAATTTTPSGTYGATGSAIDPTTGYSYDYLTQLANGQLGNLDQQGQVSNQNILDSYNTQLNALNSGQAQTQNTYNNASAGTLQDYVAGRGTEQAQIGQQANALQRLLGSYGYSGSGNQAGAYLTALQGTQANNALQNDYAKNQQALDTNYGNYNQQLQTQLGSLAQQKTQQQNALQASIASTKSGLLQQLAGIASANGGNTTNYLDQINTLGQQATALGQNYANPVLQATAPVYQAPSLASYDAPTAAAATATSDNPAAANVNPYLSVLLGGQDKNNLNNV